MVGKNQHAVPRSDEWSACDAGKERVWSIDPTQADAARTAREIAINQRNEVVVHRPDGRIHNENFGGYDPYPPEG